MHIVILYKYCPNLYWRMIEMDMTFLSTILKTSKVRIIIMKKLIIPIQKYNKTLIS